MALENLSIKEIEAELLRRKSAVVDGIRAELESAKKTVRELEAKLTEALGTAKKEAKAARAPKSRLTPGEKADLILKALAGKGQVTAETVAGIVGFDGQTLRDALGELVTERKVVKEGKARGTKYQLA
jgi:predicted HTH transcriptional regulator